MQKIYFEPPTPEGFLSTLQPLWSNGALSACLIGHNSLAEDIAATAFHQGVTVQRSDAPPPADSVKTQLLILTEQQGEELGKQLLSCVDLDNAVVVAPITDWHFSQKPLFLISIPKSGTHLIYELAQALGYHAGVEAPEFPIGQTWYCVEYTNSHTVARNFFVDTVRRSPFGNRHHCFMRSPALFIYRHPLDILISEAHYYHQDGKTAFAGWLDGADFDERVARLLDDNWLVGSLRERIGSFLPWLDFPNIISLSFEELIGAAGGGNDADQLKLIWSILLKLQAPGDPLDIASRLFNPDSATFRSGQLGGYKNHLPAQIISDFVIQNKDILTKLGYPTDGSIGLPVNSESRRKQKIQFSKADYENMPLNIESDFLGCNLVRYCNRIYAVPIAAGQVALATLPDEVLAAIPSAPSLSEIKATLLIGNADLSGHRQSLNKLAQAIEGFVPIETVYRYWADSDNPSVVEEYNGFNLVAFQNRFLGIRQSLGAINLSENLTYLLQHTTSDDFLIARSLDQLRDDIDGFSTLKRATHEVTTMHVRAMAMVEAQLVKFTEDALAERKEAATAHARAMAMADTLEVLGARLKLYQSEVEKQQQLICDLQNNWAIRIFSRIQRILRGNK